MATKRAETSKESTYADGTKSILRILSFLTPEDYMELAVSAQITALRSGNTHPYTVNLMGRAARDTFLRLNLTSGLEEISDG